MLCCFLIALAATPGGAWLIGPSSLACYGRLRAWAWPVAQAFAAALVSAMATWGLFALTAPSQDLFQPLCRVGDLIGRAVN